MADFSVSPLIIPVTVYRTGGKTTFQDITNEIKVMKTEMQNFANVSVSGTSEAIKQQTKYSQIVDNNGNIIKATMTETGKAFTVNGQEYRGSVKTILADNNMWQQSLNKLRWTMVNITFVSTLLYGVAKPFIEITKQAIDLELSLARINGILSSSRNPNMGLPELTKQISEATSAEEKYNSIMQTTAMQMKTLKNDITENALPIGKMLNDALVVVLEKANSALVNISSNMYSIFDMVGLADDYYTEAQIKGIEKYKEMWNKTFFDDLTDEEYAKYAGNDFAKAYVDGMNEYLEDANLKGISLDVENFLISMPDKAGFKLKERADAFKKIARTGFGDAISKEILPNVLKLSQTYEVDLNTAIDSITNTMHAFTKENLSSSQIMTLYGETADKFSTTVSHMTVAMNYAAPQAALMGIKFADLAVAVGFLAETGLESSKAGTALRNFLNNIQDPASEATSLVNELGLSFYDSEEKLKNFPAILANLKVGLEGLTGRRKNEIIGTLFSLRGQAAAIIGIEKMIVESGRISALILATERLEVEKNKAAYDSLKSTIEGFELSISDTEAGIKQYKKNIESTKNILVSLNNELVAINNSINVLSQSRFNGETEVLGLMKEVELYIKKQKFATYGLGTAQQFLHDAVLKSSNGVEDLVSNIDNVIDKTNISKNSYEAWQETVREFIKDAITIGNKLSSNVSSAINKYSTLLLSTSKFSDEQNEQSKSASVLGEAYDIYYGSMHDKINETIDAHNREGETVFSNTDQVITALEKQWAAQNSVTKSIDLTTQYLSKQESELDKLVETLDEYKRLLEDATKAMENYNKASTAKVDSVIGPSFGPQLPSDSYLKYSAPIDSYNEQMINSVLLGNNFGQGTSTSLFGPPRNDFVFRPGSKPFNISPQDTLIGVKDTNKLGSITIGDIIVNSNSNNPQELAQLLAREIKRELTTI